MKKNNKSSSLLDVLCDEIKRLRGMREKKAAVCRVVNERKLKVCKLRLQGLLGAVVLFFLKTVCIFRQRNICSWPSIWEN